MSDRVYGREATKTGAVISIGDDGMFRAAPMCHTNGAFAKENSYVTCSVCDSPYWNPSLKEVRYEYRSSFSWEDIESLPNRAVDIQEWCAAWLGIEPNRVSVTIIDRVRPAR